MAKRRFQVSFSVGVEVLIDESIFESVKEPSWAETMGWAPSENEVVETIAKLCGVDGCEIQQVEGFADHQSEEVSIEYVHADLDEIEEVKE